MHPTVRGSIASILTAVQRSDEAERAYRADPAFRREDQESDLQEIRDSRETAISTAAGQIDRTFARVESEFARHRYGRWSDAAVAAAERRIEAMFSAGLGIADVLDSPGITRDMIEALRRIVPVHLATTQKGASKAEVETRLAEIDAAILRAELPFMPPAEQIATQDELERRQAVPAIAALGRYLAAVRIGRADASSLMTLGYALNDGGFEDDGPAVDRSREADKARNSLPPHLRAELEANGGYGPLAEAARAAGTA